MKLEMEACVSLQPPGQAPGSGEATSPASRPKSSLLSSDLGSEVPRQPPVTSEATDLCEAAPSSGHLLSDLRTASILGAAEAAPGTLDLSVISSSNTNPGPLPSRQADTASARTAFSGIKVSLYVSWPLIGLFCQMAIKLSNHRPCYMKYIKLDSDFKMDMSQLHFNLKPDTGSSFLTST